MRTGKVDHKIVDQEVALDSYLMNLLEEIPSDLTLDQEKQKPVQKISEKTPQVKSESVKAKTEINSSVDIKSTLTEQATALKVVNPLSVMPEWTQHEFQALFFKVGSLILAAPLTELLRTIKIEKLPTKIPGQPSWFMGLLDTHNDRIGVLDTGQLILGKVRGQKRDLEQEPFQRILITHDGKWGLACDEILSIGKLTPEKVRWRTLRQKRPWLVGTVIEELTAIIDVDKLVPHRKTSG